MLGKALVKDPQGIEVTGAMTDNTATVSDFSKTGSTTFVKTGHGFTEGRQVRVMKQGNSRFKQGTRKWVKYVSGKYFRLSDTPNGPAIEHHNKVKGLKLRLVPDRIYSTGQPFSNGDRVTMVANGGGLLEDGKRYWVVRAQSNHFSLARDKGGRPLDVGENLSGIQVVNRVRKFVDRSPGDLLGKLWDEATARGWGSFLSKGFGELTDSALATWNLWLTYPVEFGWTLRQVVEQLVDVGSAEPSTLGRQLKLWNSGRGTHTGLRIRVETALPVSFSLDEVATHATVAGDGVIRSTADSTAPLTVLGRLEVFESTDARSKNAADHRAARNIRISTPAVEYRVTHLITQGVIPFIDYQLRDWVYIQDSTGWVEVQVLEIMPSFTEDMVELVVGTRRDSIIRRIGAKTTRIDLKEYTKSITKRSGKGKKPSFYSSIGG